MRFAYEALNHHRQREQGFLEAPNREEAYAVLQSRGLLPLSIRPSQDRGRRRMGAKDLSVFFRQFAALARTGEIRLDTALRILADQTPARYRAAVEQVAQDIERGQPLPRAMANAGFVPKLALALLEVAERTGKRDEVLPSLAEHYKREAYYISKVKRALTYPAATLTLALLLSYAMLTFIVPTMVGVLKDLNVEVPLPTRVLMALSDLARSPLLPAVLAGAGLALRALWAQVSADPRRQEQLDEALLRVPALGPTLKRMILARVARTVAMVYSSGLSLQETLTLAAEVAGSRPYAKALGTTLELVTTHGLELSRALARADEARPQPSGPAGGGRAGARLFPPLFTQLVHVGEKSSQLQEMLEHVADIYEEEVETVMDNLQSLLEPLLLVFVGVVVGGMLLAVMLPYFSLAQGISG